MARKIRIFFKDTPQHVVIQGIDSKVIFREEEDYYAFLEMLKILVKSIEIEIHAYILMPTYFQFIATPLHKNALSKFMQSLGRRYVGYFNKKYERRGTLWEGRYKSSLVEADRYLYEVMKFIETKPKDFKEYPYSSFQKNFFSKDDAIVTLHKNYSYKNYTDFFKNSSDENVNAIIASSLEKQTITGSKEFSIKLEQELGVALGVLKRGRPKTKNIRKKMYSNLTVINKIKHKNLKVSKIENFSFAKDVKFIPAVYTETSLIGEDYPLVITAGENPFLGVIVSLDGDNLFLNEEGKWYGSYVPAYLRKYPFALGASNQNPEEKLLLIDIDSSLVSESVGGAIFNEDGTQSELFQEKITLISAYERDRKKTEEIIKILVNADILESGEITVGEGEEKKVLVNGFQAVSRAKFEALNSETKKDWEAMGITKFVEAHLNSLNNINRLFALARQQQK